MQPLQHGPLLHKAPVKPQQMPFRHSRPEPHGVPFVTGGCVQKAENPLQMFRVQTFPSSEQGVPASLNWLAGHVAEPPVQTSATSHSPAGGRQSAVAGKNWLTGQSSEMPSHASATSQTPAAARQTVPVDFGASPHPPLLQVASAHSWEADGVGQALPHDPQLAVSICRFVQIPPQFVAPALQVGPDGSDGAAGTQLPP
jgi:hypothetical protein